MTEAEKCAAGLLYQTIDPQREAAHLRCADLCVRYNQLLPSQTAQRDALLRQILGSVGKNIYVEPTFYCSFGTNITVGDDFYANHNCVFIDPAPITFGDHVMIAPSCGFYTAGHPLDVPRRNSGLEFAYPITVGDNVWIGGNTVVLPGVTIGSNTVIGAGSVVTRDIPAGVLAFGNPCRVIRPITDADAEGYLIPPKTW